MKDEKKGRMNETTGQKMEREWDKLKDNTRQAGNRVSEKATEGAHRTQEQFKEWRNDADTQATKTQNRVKEKEQQIDNRIDESFRRAKDDLHRSKKDK